MIEKILIICWVRSKSSLLKLLFETKGQMLAKSAKTPNMPLKKSINNVSCPFPICFNVPEHK